MVKTNSLTLIDFLVPEAKNEVLRITKDVILVLSFAILTGISAKLKIEMGPVPFTMQTLVVLIGGVLLGSKRGVFSQIIYLSWGLFGFPWFSRGGGISYILSPTFGYILGFVLAAYLVGNLAEKGWDRNIKTSILAMLLGNIVIYIPGLLWLTRWINFPQVLTIGFYPFIFGDILKLLLAGSLLPFGWKIVNNGK